MLNANPNRKSLGLHGHLVSVQHGEGVTRTVAQSHHRMVRWQFICLTRVLVQNMQRLELALIVIADICHTLCKPNLATQSNDFCPQAFDHLHQLESSDVRMRRPQNFFGGTKAHKFIHDFATQVSRVFNLAVELAI